MAGNSSAGVASGKTRSSGETAATETARTLKDELDLTMAVEESGEAMEHERRRFRTPGFHRMRLDWRSDDRDVLIAAQHHVQKQVLQTFADAYQVMYEVYDLVRTPETNPDGSVKKDVYGLTEWKQSASGSWDEDWTKLTVKQKEHFLFAITTRMFDWEQRAADAWAEAMFSKAQWEERFSWGFDAPMAGTVDDRTANGRLVALDERYFAILVSAYSRKADAVVRSLALLGQRIKDSMGA